jgi:hypothetical protein
MGQIRPFALVDPHAGFTFTSKTFATKLSGRRRTDPLSGRRKADSKRKHERETAQSGSRVMSGRKKLGAGGQIS